MTLVAYRTYTQRATHIPFNNIPFIPGTFFPQLSTVNFCGQPFIIPHNQEQKPSFIIIASSTAPRRWDKRVDAIKRIYQLTQEKDVNFHLLLAEHTPTELYMTQKFFSFNDINENTFLTLSKKKHEELKNVNHPAFDAFKGSFYKPYYSLIRVSDKGVVLASHADIFEAEQTFAEKSKEELKILDLTSEFKKIRLR